MFYFFWSGKKNFWSSTQDLRCGASFFVRHAKVICLELLERHAADVTCPWLFWLHFALADFDPSEGAKVKVEIARLGEAIAERRNSHGQSRVKHFQASSATDANKSDCVAQAPPASRQKSPEYVYTCPFCNGEVTSSIASGNIDHRHVCGKQFRVENGSLRPTMWYAHTCPTCGTSVHSSREAGRIQSKHKQPNGRACPQTEWQTSWGIRCNFPSAPSFCSTCSTCSSSCCCCCCCCCCYAVSAAAAASAKSSPKTP